MVFFKRVCVCVCVFIVREYVFVKSEKKINTIFI